MFRITQMMKALHNPKPAANTARAPTGPVVIWNLIRRCNLNCRHCYSISTDTDFKGELSDAEVLTVMRDLYDFGVRVLILSGGEPMLRPGVFELSRQAKAMGFYVGLSTNGTLIDSENVKDIAAVGFDYVGISIDGMRDTHDRFRRCEGAFDDSLQGIRLCRDQGLKVGMRFTLTRDNAADLPALLTLMEREAIDKFYLSHLNYAGRGNKNRDSAVHRMTREAMDLLFETAWRDVHRGRNTEFVTGNNDADGVYLLHWVADRYPERLGVIRERLDRWGGNATGVNIANIDNLGNVHPDTMWWQHDLGNVRERPFSAIWQDRSDPLMAGLNQRPRPVTGRCATCSYLGICNGNTRVRAYQTSGDWWAEDPGCYLTDAEIGLPPAWAQGL